MALTEATLGMILYNIEMDNCLNGVYTNEFVGGEIYNEVCKRIMAIEDTDEITGRYKSQWFDSGATINVCDLDITRTHRTYHFKWSKNSGDIHEGIGYKMNERQIVVAYWAV